MGLHPTPTSVFTVELCVFLNPHILDVTFYLIEKYNRYFHWGTSCLFVYRYAYSINHVANFPQRYGISILGFIICLHSEQTRL